MILFLFFALMFGPLVVVGVVFLWWWHGWDRRVILEIQREDMLRSKLERE